MMFFKLALFIWAHVISQSVLSSVTSVLMNSILVSIMTPP
jgi:hypothetical protein